MGVETIIFLVWFRNAMLAPSYWFGVCVHSWLKNEREILWYGIVMVWWCRRGGWC